MEVWHVKLARAAGRTTQRSHVAEFDCVLTRPQIRERLVHFDERAAASTTMHRTYLSWILLSTYDGTTDHSNPH